ncbi:hypothetical protein GOODEAATRI_008325 [Goodea atripinnis]|uniref:Uncharacterized protein n=1 Tax=Goodea atripinnis TaxID=208336 RepID=A0ABV0NST7_9TELE
MNCMVAGSVKGLSSNLCLGSGCTEYSSFLQQSKNMTVGWSTYSKLVLGMGVCTHGFLSCLSACCHVIVYLSRMSSPSSPMTAGDTPHPPPQIQASIHNNGWMGKETIK